jgi:hypothetical protein
MCLPSSSLSISPSQIKRPPNTHRWLGATLPKKLILVVPRGSNDHRRAHKALTIRSFCAPTVSGAGSASLIKGDLARDASSRPVALLGRPDRLTAERRSLALSRRLCALWLAALPWRDHSFQGMAAVGLLSIRSSV